MVSETIKNFEPLEVDAQSQECDPFTFQEMLFCHFLQSWFTHEEFRGTGMYWTGSDGDDGDETTEVIITSEKPELASVEKVPHIVCVLGSMQWAVLGLDQLQTLSMKTGQRQHTDLIPTTMAYHCQAKVGALARRIAWYAAWGTIMFRRLIMKQGRLHQIAPSLSVGAETGPTAYTGQVATEEVVSSVVTVPFYWQPQWRIRDPAPLLAGVKVDMGVLPARVRGTGKQRFPPISQLVNDLPLEPFLVQSMEVTED